MLTPDELMGFVKNELADLDAYVGEDPGLLAGVERVVDALLHRGEERLRGVVEAEQVAAVIVEPVLGEGGFVVPPSDYLPRLRALGRLTEALEPMRVSIEKYSSQKDWLNAARLASNLSELEVTLGRLGDAVADARRAIDLAVADVDAVRAIGDRFDLHPLAVADIVHTHQRPKTESYDGFVLVVLRLPVPGAGFDSEQISLVLGEGFLLR